MAAIEIARVALIWAFVACVLVLACYLPTADWYRTMLGWGLVSLDTNLVILLGYVDARAIWPGKTPVWLALSIYIWLAASTTTLAIAMFRSWRIARKGGYRRAASH